MSGWYNTKIPHAVLLLENQKLVNCGAVWHNPTKTAILLGSRF